MILSGELVLASILIKVGMQPLRLPAVVGYLVLGFALRALDDRYSFLNSESVWTLDFLGELGVASLLFHVGLRSNLDALMAMLPRAVRVWAANFFVSAGFGFLTARLLGFEILPALFVGVALSATSVSISVTVWEDAGRCHAVEDRAAAAGRGGVGRPFRDRAAAGGARGRSRSDGR